MIEKFHSIFSLLFQYLNDLQTLVLVSFKYKMRNRVVKQKVIHFFERYFVFLRHLIIIKKSYIKFKYLNINCEA
jgi:hypothetical protein